MSTQQLKELSQKCLSMRVEVDQNAAYANFIAHVEPQEIVSLFERLEAAERERDNAQTSRDLHREVSVVLNDRLIAAETELARRDAAASEPVGYLFTSSEGQVVYSPCPWVVEGLTLQGPIYTAPHPAVVSDAAAGEPVGLQCMGDSGKWQDCASREVAESHGFTMFRELYTAAQPAVLPVVTDLAVELLTAALIDGADAKTALTLAAPSLGAQPQKPVVLPFLNVAIKHVFGIGAYRADEVLAALAAAGVPYEVKK
ncbi:hypothetical protein [Erwinia rhapontici]|uniref:hypothetical protein n=1 Tax=Erwinia rhapontici TaxID=55212 RepID=UPI001331855E|nr:hypothetical protein [Erwinia rhapontici]MBP2156921.1 hypothetical protein [Erwinia rhapontici]